ncbi:MAG: hypothetical protein AB8Y80_00330 [Coxiella endosymbiont of Haemaphysalis japonica]
MSQKPTIYDKYKEFDKSEKDRYDLNKIKPLFILLRDEKIRQIKLVLNCCSYNKQKWEDLNDLKKALPQKKEMKKAFTKLLHTL